MIQSTSASNNNMNMISSSSNPSAVLFRGTVLRRDCRKNHNTGTTTPTNHHQEQQQQKQNQEQQQSSSSSAGCKLSYLPVPTLDDQEEPVLETGWIGINCSVDTNNNKNNDNDKNDASLSSMTMSLSTSTANQKSRRTQPPPSPNHKHEDDDEEEDEDEEEQEENDNNNKTQNETSRNAIPTLSSSTINAARNQKRKSLLVNNEDDDDHSSSSVEIPPNAYLHLSANERTVYAIFGYGASLSVYYLDLLSDGEKKNNKNNKKKIWRPLEMEITYPEPSETSPKTHQARLAIFGREEVVNKGRMPWNKVSPQLYDLPFDNDCAWWAKGETTSPSSPRPILFCHSYALATGNNNTGLHHHSPNSENNHNNFGMLRVIDLQNKTVSLLCVTEHPHCKLNLTQHGICLFGVTQGSSDSSIGLLFGGYNLLLAGSGSFTNSPNGLRNSTVLVASNIPHYHQRKRLSAQNNDNDQDEDYDDDSDDWEEEDPLIVTFVPFTVAPPQVFLGPLHCIQAFLTPPASSSSDSHHHHHHQNEDPVIYAIGDQRAFELQIEKIRAYLIKKEAEADNFITLSGGNNTNSNNNINNTATNLTMTSYSHNQVNATSAAAGNNNRGGKLTQSADDLKEYIKNTPPASASDIEQWNKWWSFVKPSNPQDITICKVPHVAVQGQGFTLAVSRFLKSSGPGFNHNNINASHHQGHNHDELNNNNNAHHGSSGNNIKANRRPEAVLVSTDGRAVYVFAGGSWHGPMRVSNPMPMLSEYDLSNNNNNTDDNQTNSSSMTNINSSNTNNNQNQQQQYQLYNYQLDDGSSSTGEGRATPLLIKPPKKVSASSSRPHSAVSGSSKKRKHYLTGGGLENDQPPSLPSWALARAGSARPRPDLSQIPPPPASSEHAKKLLANSSKILIPARPIVAEEPLTARVRHDHRVANQVVNGFLNARRKERSVFEALRNFAREHPDHHHQNNNNNNNSSAVVSRPSSSRSRPSSSRSTNNNINNNRKTQQQRPSSSASSSNKNQKKTVINRRHHFDDESTVSDNDDDPHQEGILDLRHCCPAESDDWLVLQHFASVHSKIRQLDVRGEILNESSEVALALFLASVATLPFLTHIDFSPQVFIDAYLENFSENSAAYQKQHHHRHHRQSNNNSNNKSLGKGRAASTSSSTPASLLVDLDDPYSYQKKKNAHTLKLLEKQKKEQEFYKAPQQQHQRSSSSLSTSTSTAVVSAANTRPTSAVTNASSTTTTASPSRAQMSKMKHESAALFEKLETLLRTNINNVQDHERGIIMKRFDKVYQVLAHEHHVVCERASAAHSMNEYFYAVHVASRFAEEHMIERKFLLLEQDSMRDQLWAKFSVATKDRLVMSHYFQCTMHLIIASEEVERLSLRVTQDRAREGLRLDSKADLADAVERKGRRVAFERMLRGQREEVKREETLARNATRAEEDREKAPLFEEARRVIARIREKEAEQKRQRDLEAQRKAEEERLRKLDEDRLAARIAERKAMHEHQIENLITESVKNRDSIVHDWGDLRKRTTQAWRIMKALIERYDNFVERHHDRERAALIPPNLQVSSLPSSISVAAGNQVPVSICSLSGVLVEPVVATKIEDVPKYMVRGNPQLENGELVLQQWSSRKTTILAARCVVQLEEYFPHLELVMAPKSGSGIKIVGNRDQAGPMRIYISGYDEPVGFVHYHPSKTSVDYADSDEELLEESGVADVKLDEEDEEDENNINNEEYNQLGDDDNSSSSVESQIEDDGLFTSAYKANKDGGDLSSNASSSSSISKRKKKLWLLPEPAAVVFEIFLSTRTHLAQGAEVMRKLQQQLLLLRSKNNTTFNNNGGLTQQQQQLSASSLSPGGSMTSPTAAAAKGNNNNTISSGANRDLPQVLSSLTPEKLLAKLISCVSVSQSLESVPYHMAASSQQSLHKKQQSSSKSSGRHHHHHHHQHDKINLQITVTTHSPNYLKTPQQLPTFREEVSATEFAVPNTFASQTFASSRMAALVTSEEVEEEILSHWRYANRVFNKNAVLVPPLSELKSQSRHTTIARWSDRMELHVMNLVIWKKPAHFEVDLQSQLCQKFRRILDLKQRQEENENNHNNNNTNHSYFGNEHDDDDEEDEINPSASSITKSLREIEKQQAQFEQQHLAQKLYIHGRGQFLPVFDNTIDLRNDIVGNTSQTPLTVSESLLNPSSATNNAMTSSSSPSPGAAANMMNSSSNNNNNNNARHHHQQGLQNPRQVAQQHEAQHKAQFDALLNVLNSTLSRMNGTIVVQFDDQQKSSHDDEDCLILKTAGTNFPTFPNQQQQSSTTTTTTSTNNNNNNILATTSPSRTNARYNVTLTSASPSPMMVQNSGNSDEQQQQHSNEISPARYYEYNNNNNNNNNNNTYDSNPYSIAALTVANTASITAPRAGTISASPENNNNNNTRTDGGDHIQSSTTTAASSSHHSSNSNNNALIPRIVEVPSLVDPTKSTSYIFIFWKSHPLVIVEQRGVVEIPGVGNNSIIDQQKVVRAPNGSWQIASLSNVAAQQQQQVFSEDGVFDDNATSTSTQQPKITFDLLQPSPEPTAASRFNNSYNNNNNSNNNQLLASAPKSFEPAIFKICENAPSEGLRVFLQSIYYFNSAKPQFQQRPIEGTRRIVAGVRLRTGLEAHVATNIDVVSLVGNSIFDFSTAPVVPYRSTLRLCDWKYLPFYQEPLFHFAANCSILRDCESYLQDPDGPATLDIEILNPQSSDLLMFDFSEEGFITNNVGILGTNQFSVNGLQTAATMMLDAYEDEECVTKIFMPAAASPSSAFNNRSTTIDASMSILSNDKMFSPSPFSSPQQNKQQNTRRRSSCASATYFSLAQQQQQTLSSGKRRKSSVSSTINNPLNQQGAATTTTSRPRRGSMTGNNKVSFTDDQQNHQHVPPPLSTTSLQFERRRSTDSSSSLQKAASGDINNLATSVGDDNNTNVLPPPSQDLDETQRGDQQQQQPTEETKTEDDHVLAEAKHLEPQHIRITLKQGKWTKDLLQQLVRALVFINHPSSNKNCIKKKTPAPLDIGGVVSTSTSTGQKQSRHAMAQQNQQLLQHCVHLQQDPYHFNQKHSVGPARIVQFRLTSPSNLMNISDPPGSTSPSAMSLHNNNNNTYNGGPPASGIFSASNNSSPEHHQFNNYAGSTYNKSSNYHQSSNFANAMMMNVSPSPMRVLNTQNQLGVSATRRISTFMMPEQSDQDQQQHHQGQLSNTSFASANNNNNNTASSYNPGASSNFQIQNNNNTNNHYYSVTAQSVSLARDTQSMLWASPGRDVYGFTKTFEESLLGIAKSSMLIRPTKPLGWIEGRRLLPKKMLLLQQSKGLEASFAEGMAGENSINNNPTTEIRKEAGNDDFYDGNNNTNNASGTDTSELQLAQSSSFYSASMRKGALLSSISGTQDSSSGQAAHSHNNHHHGHHNNNQAETSNLPKSERKRLRRLLEAKRELKNKAHEWKYTEGAGAVPVANLSLVEEETSWEGGRIVVEIVEGCENDDIILFQETNTNGIWSTSIEDENNKEGGENNTNNNSNDQHGTTTTSPQSKLRFGQSSNKLDESSVANPAAGSSVNFVNNNNNDEPFTGGDLFSKKQIVECSGATTLTPAAIRKKELEMKIAQEETERRKNATIKTRIEKPLYFNKAKVGTIVFLPGKLCIQFNVSKKQLQLYTMVANSLMNNNNFSFGSMTMNPNQQNMSFFSTNLEQSSLLTPVPPSSAPSAAGARSTRRNIGNTFSSTIESSSTSSSNACKNIRRKDIVSLLQSICFASVSDNVEDGAKKIIAVRIKDSSPHESCDFSTIKMEAVDDPTEFRRPTAAPVSLKVNSDEDREGFAPFNDVSLFDPDTFSFNSTTLRAEILSGGDYRGDALTVLSAARQKNLRGKDTAIVTASAHQELENNKSTKTALMYDGKKIADAEFEMRGQVGAPCRVVIEFIPLAEMLSESKNNNNNEKSSKSMNSSSGGQPLEVSSSDDDENNNNNKNDNKISPEDQQQQEHEQQQKALEKLNKNPDLVTLPMLETVLRSLRFQASNPSTKAGNRILRGQLFCDEVESHIDIIVHVTPPLLTNPEWHVTRSFIAGTPITHPTILAPNLALHISEKVAVKKAKIIATVDDSTVIEGHDRLDLQYLKGGFITIGKKGVLWSKEYLCNIIQSPPSTLTLTFDQKETSTNFNSTHLQALLRCVAFSTTSQIIGHRQVQMFIQVDNKSYRYDAYVHVLAPDDIRVDRILFRQSKISVTRGLKQPYQMLSGLELFISPENPNSGAASGGIGANSNSIMMASSGAGGLMLNNNAGGGGAASAGIGDGVLGDGNGGATVPLRGGGEVHIHLTGGGLRENDRLIVHGLHLDELTRPTAVIYGEAEKVTSSSPATASITTPPAADSSTASFENAASASTTVIRPEQCRVTLKNNGRTLRFDLSPSGNCTSSDLQQILRRVSCLIPQSENPRQDHAARRSVMIVFDLDRSPRFMARADLEVASPFVSCVTTMLKFTPKIQPTHSELRVFDGAVTNSKLFSKGVTVIVSAYVLDTSSSSNSFSKSVLMMNRSTTSAKHNNTNNNNNSSRIMEGSGSIPAAVTDSSSSQQNNENNIDDSYLQPFVIDLNTSTLNDCNINPDVGVVIRNSSELVPAGFREKQTEIMHQIAQKAQRLNASPFSATNTAATHHPAGSNKKRTTSASSSRKTSPHQGKKSSGGKDSSGFSMDPVQFQQQLNLIQNSGNKQLLKYFPQLAPLQHSPKPGQIFVDGKRVGTVDRTEGHKLEIILNPDGKAASYLEKIFRAIHLSFHKLTGTATSFEIAVKATITDTRKGVSEISRVISVPAAVDDFVQCRSRPVLLGTPKALKAQHLEKTRSFSMASSSAATANNNNTKTGKSSKSIEGVEEL